MLFAYESTTCLSDITLQYVYSRITPAFTLPLYLLLQILSYLNISEASATVQMNSARLYDLHVSSTRKATTQSIVLKYGVSQNDHMHV